MMAIEKAIVMTELFVQKAPQPNINVTNDLNFRILYKMCQLSRQKAIEIILFK